MKNITYTSLKFKTDPSFLDDEKYCENLSDFDIRRMAIKEYKDILHVLFSKRMVVDALSVLSLIIAIFATATFSTVSFLVLSFIFLIVRFRLAVKYKGYYRTLNMIVSLLDKKIKENYNMDMDPIF